MSRYSPADPLYNQAYWSEVMNQKGAAKAYAEFKDRTGKLPLERQHVAAHVIGALIGEAEGARGVATCDPTFSFGCYHGLFGTIVAREGSSIIPELDAACVGAFGPLGTGCQHGIGHGILEYTGYEKLDEALALCRHTTERAPLLGCSSGVFMEYHQPLSGAPDTLLPSVRTFDPSNSYEPCDAISGRYRASCFFELGVWFERALPEGKGGELCAALPQADRLYCALGAGAGIGERTTLSVEVMRTHCSTFGDAGEAACRAGVRWSLWANPNERSRAEEACVDPDISRQAACETLGDLTKGAYAS